MKGPGTSFQAPALSQRGLSLSWNLCWKSRKEGIKTKWHSYKWLDYGFKMGECNWNSVIWVF